MANEWYQKQDRSVRTGQRPDTVNDQTVQLLRESSILDPQIMSASVSNRNMNEFCLSIPFAAAATDSSDSSSSSDGDDDSGVEVVFTRDERQDDLAPMNDLRLQSDDSDDDDNENRIAKEACLAKEMHAQTLLKTNSKQLTLSELWKKK